MDGEFATAPSVPIPGRVVKGRKYEAFPGSVAWRTAQVFRSQLLAYLRVLSTIPLLRVCLVLIRVPRDHVYRRYVIGLVSGEQVPSVALQSVCAAVLESVGEVP